MSFPAVFFWDIFDNCKTDVAALAVMTDQFQVTNLPGAQLANTYTIVDPLRGACNSFLSANPCGISDAFSSAVKVSYSSAVYVIFVCAMLVLPWPNCGAIAR